MAEAILTHPQAYDIALRFKEALRARGVPFAKMFLFGSYAKKEPRPWSDLDIAVVSPVFGRDYTQESVLINRIADEIDPIIEAHPMSEEAMQDRWSTFSKEVQQGEEV